MTRPRGSASTVLLLAAGFATALPAPRALEAQARPLAYDDYYRIVGVGSPAISPDGARVAFVRSVVVEEANRTHREVWLAEADGSDEPRRMTAPSTEASSPQWSPDGRLLAFDSFRPLTGADGSGSTWFLRMDAPGEAFRIPGLDGSPIFDPTNRRIAFTRSVRPDGSPPAGPELTDEERRIVERFDGRAYDWMQFRFDRRGYLPDPRDPWATPPTQIFVLPRDGGEAIQLTRLRVDATDVTWRPDGEALAFAADEHQRDEHSYPRADLWTVTLDGELTRLTDDEYDWGDPVWSPDGAWLVASGQVGLDVIIRERWDHGSPNDLWLFRADGSERRNLTESWDLIPGTPTWSPDGRHLHFTANVGGNTHLFRLEVARGSVEQITYGDGRIGSVSFSADGSTMAYLGQDATHPADVYAGPVGGSGRQLTAFNADLLGELDLRTPERMLFESADGTEIERRASPHVGHRVGQRRN